jgi:ferredoxin
MAFVVTDACIRCKYMDCVTVCPVDCFREGENMLVIAPGECIDCGACWGACPARAILADSEAGADQWTEHNRTYAGIWPMVARKAGQTPPDADAFCGVAGKFDAFFSADPGAGNVPDARWLADYLERPLGEDGGRLQGKNR